MSEKELNKIQTDIALLKKDAKTGELIHQRLEVAVDKLSDCAISLKGMLATQEQKLSKAEQTDDDIFITLESRRKEWDNDLKELHQRSGSYQALFSRRAKLFHERQLGAEDLDESRYKALLLEHYTFLKRQVLIWEDEIYIGSSKATIEQAYKTLHPGD